MLDHTRLLLSHRTHETGFSSATLSMHRAIGPGFIVRHATLRGVAQDQRPCAAMLGVDRPRRRNALTIPLEGSLTESTEHRELRADAGQMLYLPEGATSAGRASGEFLEIEWETNALGEDVRSKSVATSLGQTTLTAARRLADTLRSATSHAEVTAPLATLFVALRSEGLDLRPESVEALPRTTAEDQALFSCIDAQLSALASAPMFVDFERSMHASRRTMTRRVRALSERYRLTEGDSWRKIRDEYRLVVAAILLSHHDATPRAVASTVGYGSVEALDHAFRNAEMDSPLAFQRTLRAA